MNGTGTKASAKALGSIVAGALVASLLVVMAPTAQAAPATGPMASVSDVAVSEGNSGTTSFTFTVTLSSAMAVTSSVKWAATAGTAAAGSDFTASTGMVTFAAGEKTKPFTVSVAGDRLHEIDENFTVTLSRAGKTSPRLGDKIGVGNIMNDDPLPAFSVANASVTEGNAGLRSLTFPVSLTSSELVPLSVGYETAGGSASSGDDYTPAVGTLTFAPGDLTQLVQVPVKGDIYDEDNETLLLNLTSPVGAGIVPGSGVATGTITDDDAAPKVSISDTVASEPASDGSNDALFTVTLSAPSQRNVSVDWATSDGENAKAGEDYVGASGTVNFAPNQTQQQVSITLLHDATSTVPSAEFYVDLSAPVNAELGRSQASGTILDYDPRPVITAQSVSSQEGDEGTREVQVTIGLSIASADTITVDYATADGTAGAADYTSAAGTLTFAPGERSKTVSVPVTGDALYEADETFQVVLSNAGETGQPVEGDDATVTINNDDVAPAVAPAKTASKTSIRLIKRRLRIIARGTVQKPAPGQRLIVTLSKKRAGKWVRVATKRPLLSAATDVNGDGFKESTFKARFRRPARGRIFKVVAKYRGDSQNLASSAIRRVRYRR